MRLPVLIEANPNGGTGFIARLYTPFALSAEGASRDEAVANLQHASDIKFSTVEVASIEAPKGSQLVDEIETDLMPHDPIASMLDHSGTICDDELTRAWIQTIKENRIRKDLEDERLGREW